MVWLKRFFGLVLVLGLALVAFVVTTWAPDRQLGDLLPRWGGPPSSFVELDGMQVHIRDVGPRDDPQPIVLMHMRAGSLHSFSGWQDTLSRTRRVVTLDLPGFGLTGPSKDGNYKIDAYIRFILRFLDTLGIRQVVLGGHALGGEIAWRTAVLAPERVSRLILIDADGYQLSPLSQPIAFQLARIRALRWISERVLPYSIVESSVRDLSWEEDAVRTEVVDRVFDLNLRVGNRRALFQFMDQQESGSHQQLIRRVSQPTLVLWGEKDRLVPTEFAYRFCQDIPKCTLVRFPKLGHKPQEDDPATTIEPVLRFLSKPDSTRQ
jgi:pimeloyl-ACP methyl ester carboxylesterase